MSYFTERNNMRSSREHTETISIEMYSLLFDCCERYMDNITWVSPALCSDGLGEYGVDIVKLSNKLKFEIPTLFHGYNNRIEAPQRSQEYDQYAFLDYIEFIAQNCRDIVSRDFHSFFGHSHLTFDMKSANCFYEFQKEINSLFEKTGLLYSLTDQKIVERIVAYDVLTEEVIGIVNTAPEIGIHDLLDEAIAQFKQPNPASRGLAVEKIWDALERLKTYYCTAGMDKRTSVSQIVNDMSNGSAEFRSLFDDEFRALTTIGNNYRIRHHEMTKIDISDIKHYDYFFNRCLSLISLAIQYLH